MLFLESYLSNKGEIKLYAKFVFSHDNEPKLWGFKYDNSNKLYLNVPLWVDIINTCGTSRVVRDLSINLKHGKHTVASMVQIQKITKTKDEDETTFLGDKGSYTCMVSAKGTKRLDIEYFLLKDVIQGDCFFDHLTLSYYDEKDILHDFFLAEIPEDKCWIPGELKSPTLNKWLLLK